MLRRRVIAFLSMLVVVLGVHSIARALMNGPKVILADEPTGNLDPKTSAVIYDLFLQLQAERGIAFLIATHNPDLARKAERVYRLVEGRAREVDPSER